MISRTKRALGALWPAVLLLALPAAAAVDQREACLTCHDDIAPALDAKVPHAPVAMGECSACHNPHVSRFEGLLLDRPGPMCSSCHTELEAELDRAVVHAPVAEGRCVDCHEAHGGQNAALLTRPGTELCAGCHEDVSAWNARPVQHAPFADGDCATCHEPHAADGDGLLTGGTGEVCLSCHETDNPFRSAHQSYPVETAPCQQCHDPHASARAGLFRESLHPPFAEGNCVDCHALPGSSEPFRTNKPDDQLCGDCHEDAVAESRGAAFPHAAAGGTGCASCHNPHTANGSGLLKRPETELCLGCHDPGGSSSELEGRFVTHGEGLDCGTCHAPHGSDRPILFVDSSIEVCSACHSHQHTVAHPMGEGSRDPRTGQAMDCLSCHGLHDAPHPKYMHRDGTRDLCTSCHKDIGGSR